MAMFHTTYCPFCRRFRPIFERYSGDSGHVFAVVDITDDDNPLWDRYKIGAVPTVIAFKDGEEIGRRDSVLGVGLSEVDLKSLLQEV